MKTEGHEAEKAFAPTLHLWQFCSIMSNLCKMPTLGFEVGGCSQRWSCISIFWLLQNNQHIDDLFTDFCDGRLLISLLEIISGENLGKVGKYYYYYYIIVSINTI